MYITANMCILVNAEGHSSDDFLWFSQMNIFLFMMGDVVNYEDTRRWIDDFIFIQKQTVTVHLSCETEKKFWT